MAIYDYRIATGHNVALASLTNVENISAFKVLPGTGLAPKTQPVNRYPIRVIAMDGKTYGDGNLTHVWQFDVLPIAALQYVVLTYLTTAGATVVSKEVTIYTRIHDIASTYYRYNAYLTYPVPGEDYTYDRRYARNVRLTFTALEKLA